MNLQEILSNLNISYKSPGEHHHVGSSYYGIDCPRCSPGTGRYRLGIHRTKHFAYCWQCGHIPLKEALKDSSGESWGKVWENLKHLQKNFDSSTPVQNGKYTPPPGIVPLLPGHRKYLQGRGLDPDAIASIWEVQGIGLSSRLPWRLFIPVHNPSGIPCSWTTRSLGSTGMRYISASQKEESSSHKEMLYGEHLASHSIIVVEGPVDAWAIGPGAVATFGTSFTPQQKLRMARFPQRIICYDNEPKAQSKAHQLANYLETFPGNTKLVTLETGKDPAECSLEELKELRSLLH